MARLSDRSAADRLRIGRRVCIAGEVLEIALCIALVLVVRPLAVGIFIAVIGGGMATVYNLFLWSNLKQQADREAAESASRRRSR
jgi:hypothetical protein